MRRFARTPGTSIVEVVVAFLLLGLAIPPIMDLFGAAVRQTRQTSDVSLAMALQEKVADELRVGFWENPHALEDPTLNVQAAIPVIDGQSPFFRGLEDTAAPFGQIEDGQDAGIDKRFTALYRELANFQFGARSTRRMLPTTGEVVDVVLEVKWKDGRQLDRSLDLLAVLPVLQVRLGMPLQVRDRALADRLIHDAFYAGRANETLEAAASASGADVNAIRDMGDIVLVMTGLAATRADFDAAVRQARDQLAAASTSLDRFRANVTLGRILESRTAAYIQAVTYLGSRIARFAAASPRLGSPPPPPAAFWDSLVMTAWLPTRLSESIGETAKGYTDAYNDPSAATLPRIRARVFMKLLELAKLQSLTGGVADTSYLTQVVDGFSVAEAGRHRSFDQFSQIERQLVSSLATLRSSYAAPERIAAWTSVSTNAGPVAQALLPQGNGGAPQSGAPQAKPGGQGGGAPPATPGGQGGGAPPLTQQPAAPPVQQPAQQSAQQPAQQGVPAPPPPPVKAASVGGSAATTLPPLQIPAGTANSLPTPAAAF